MAKNDEKDGAAAEGAAVNPNKKLIIMIVIGALALIILSALAVYLIMSDGGEKPPEAKENVSELSADPADLDKKGNLLPAIYHEIKPPFLASLPPESPHKLLQVSLQFMSRQPAIMDFLTTNEPLIKHHLLNLLSSQNAEELKTRAGKEKLQQAITDKIHQLATEMGAEGKLAKVYFTRMVME
ncbi:MAG: flagellar basal body-associated FliL family protein [Gammaproteobacteria bacterium]|nr:flagellar basal body-associated FliL family protein [Gammaproteobacteria bacterium]